MKSWVDYVRRVDGDDHGWRYVFHYGDWLALDNLNQTAEQVMGGNIPQQYRNRSVKELAVSFASEAAGGKLERLERYLSGI